MPEKLFSFKKKIAIINLSKNEIDTISFDLTSALELQEIDLSFNKIMKLDLDSMQKLEARRKIPLAINMSNNSFCNCKSLDFLRWIKESICT